MAEEDNTTNTTDETKPVTMTSDEIKEFVVKAVNGAVSSHLSRALEKQFGSFQKQMEERLASFQTNEQTTEAVTDEAKNAQARYEKMIAELKEQVDRERQQREQAETRRLVDEEKSALHTALTARGVPGPLASAAVTYLREDLKRLERDSSGNLVFLVPEKGPTGNYTDRLAIDEGVAKFLKSDEGKHFLPAKDVKGSGNPGGGSPSLKGQEVSDQDVVLSAILGQLS